MERKHFLDYFENSIRKNWDAPSFDDYGSDVAFTYGEMADKIAHIHAMFESLGLQQGDKVALCGRNSSLWAINYLATISYGCVAVSILCDFSTESIEALVNHSDSKLFLVGPVVWKNITPANMPNLQAIISIEDSTRLYSANDEVAKSFDRREEIYKTHFPEGLKPELVKYPRFSPETPMLINYTSGSTGDPKGVVLSWRSIDSNMQFSQERIPNSPDDRLLSMLPMAHMFGLAIEVMYQVAGGTHITVLNKTPSPAVLMKALSDVHPYMMLVVPLVIEKVFKSKIFPVIHKPFIRVLWHTPGINCILHKKVYEQLMNAFGGNLRYLIIGGAALNHEVENALKAIHFPFTVGYGMTECGPLVCYEDWPKFKHRSCGKPVDRLEVRIDSENPQRKVGEILVKGDNVMLGYYKNETATKAIFTADGWMRTGDLGVMDKQGNLSIRGRSKSMILGPSGQNIYPEEIEGKLNNMPCVVESLIVDRDGKLTALTFVDEEQLKKTQPGKSVTEFLEETRQRVNKLLPAFCRIAAMEQVTKEFEKTPKRSIKRFMYK